MSLLVRLCRKVAASAPVTSTLPWCDRSKSTAPDRACRYSASGSPKWEGTSQPASSTKTAPALSATACSGVCSAMLFLIDDRQHLVGVLQKHTRPARIDQALD